MKYEEATSSWDIWCRIDEPLANTRIISIGEGKAALKSNAKLVISWKYQTMRMEYRAPFRGLWRKRRWLVASSSKKVPPISGNFYSENPRQRESVFFVVMYRFVEADYKFADAADELNPPD